MPATIARYLENGVLACTVDPGVAIVQDQPGKLATRAPVKVFFFSVFASSLDQSSAIVLTHALSGSRGGPCHEQTLSYLTRTEP
jgi:hypothetical protein